MLCSDVYGRRTQFQRTGVETIDITACDREPIHVPGSIQRYGCMLIADAELRILRSAGAGESNALLGQNLTELVIGRELFEPATAPDRGVRILGAVSFRDKAKDGP